jgi:hypothetical protein
MATVIGKKIGSLSGADLARVAARAWLAAVMKPHPALEDEKPLDVIAVGSCRKVSGLESPSVL